MAGLAADLPQDSVQVCFGTARARHKQHLGRERTARNRHSRHFEVVGKARIKMGDMIGLSRRESVELARLRTGHTTMLRMCRHRIGLEDDTNAPTVTTGSRRMWIIYRRRVRRGRWRDTTPSAGTTQH